MDAPRTSDWVAANDFHDVRDALEARVVELATELLGASPNKEMSSRREARWGRKGAFALALTGPKRGLWRDHEAGEGGDMLALIRRERGGGFPDALAWARAWLGWAGERRHDPTKAAQRRREREAKAAREAAAQALDEQRRVARAQSIWSASRPLAGTAGEAYLRRTRAIAAEAWPTSVRWSDHERAVVFAVTANAGDVVAVQLVAISPGGTQDKTRWPHGAKQTQGVLSRGVLRFPGRADGPQCFAEGPETALTIWAATGYATFATIGSLKRAAEFAPTERRIALSHDDDPKGSPAVKAANAARVAIAAQGGDVRDCWPWAIRRHDKSDFNDVAKADGLDAVRRRIDMAAIDEPELGELLLSLDAGQTRTGQRVAEFFELAAQWREGDAPPVHALGVTVGVGKTEAALRHALGFLQRLREQGDERAVVIAVPEHRLSGEIAARFAAMAKAEGLDLRADVWRGRGARRPDAVDDERMCGNLAEVQAAQRLAVDISNEICSVCPLQESCGYLAQRWLDADFWIVAHQAIFRKPPKPIARRAIAAFVVDESAWQSGLIGVEGRGIEIPLDALEPGIMPVGVGANGLHLTALRMNLARAMREGPATRAKLAAFGFTSATGREAAAMEWRRKIVDGPWRERIANATLGTMATLWRAVEDMMKPGRPERCGRIWAEENRDGEHVVRATGRRDVHEAWNVPTLLADASLDVAMVKPYWPTVEDKGALRVRAQHQTIRQLPARAYSKGSIGADNASGERARRKLAAQILRRVRELAAQGKTLAVGNKDVVARLDLPAGLVETAHFNAIRGRDQWRDARLIVVVGRPMPRPSAVERMAAALTGAAVETIPNFYERRDDFRLMRTARGVERIPAQRDAHPDPTADRILQRITRDEISQVVGRARGVRRGPEHPVEILIFGDVILDEPVDGFLTDDDVAVTPADLMFAAGGVAFEDGASAARAYPEIWRTAEAARVAFHREEKSCVTKPYKYSSYGNVTQLLRVAFQREGNGQRRQFAILDPRQVPDPRAEVERLVGPLALFEVVESEPEPESRGGEN